jgi:hypothetical protein
MGDYAADDESKQIIEEPIEPVKKKRGRKPKVVKDGELVVKEKKKRGRKPKVVKDGELVVKEIRVRKRGRRPKCPIKSISEIREKFKNSGDKLEFATSSNIVNDSHSKTHVPFGNLNIIIHEPPEIDTTELRKQFNKDSKLKKTEQNILKTSDFHSPINSESESDVDYKSDYSKRRPLCKCMKKDNEYIEVEKKRVFKQLHKFSKDLDTSKQWPDSTKILCWWCCHSFTNQPIPSVTSYDTYRKRYHLKGVFCSWECSASYTSENSKSLVWLYKLFREWTGEKLLKIDRAPHRYVLKAFGGHVSINEFRKSKYLDRKIYLSEDCGMSYINQDILEVYKELERKKKKKMKISRKKPLRSTKPETLFENMTLE